MAATAGIIETKSDKKWGYPFGVDGILTIAEVEEKLKLKRRTVTKLLAEGHLRKRKDNADSKQSRVRVCTRSVMQYIHRGEV